MILFRSLILSLITFSISAANAANIDDLRLHYYFLRSSLAGQSSFAKSLDDFKSHYDKSHSDPLNTNVTTYEVAQRLIEYNPKGNSGDSISSVTSDLKTLSTAGYKGSAKVFSRLETYSLFSKYLTSGEMKAPRAYEALGLKSEEELSKFRENVIFFITKSNAGTLSEEDQKSVDLLFQY